VDSTTPVWTDYIFNVYSLIVWITLVIIGAVLGAKKTITVFRNFNDLAIVFLLGAWPMFMSRLLLFIGPSQIQKNIALIFLVVVEAAIFCWIVYRTYQDNGRFWMTLLAIITKSTLSFLFLFNLISLFAPTGKTAAQRAQARQSALFWLIGLTPLIYALVRDKEGLLNPGRILAGRGIQL